MERIGEKLVEKIMEACDFKIFIVGIILALCSLSSFAIEDGTGTNTVKNLYAEETIKSASGSFQVFTNGDIIKIKGLDYNWPTNNNITNSYLFNDGNGNLSWKQHQQTITLVAPGAALQWLNHPTLETEFLGSIRNRILIDLSNVTQIRLLLNVTAIGRPLAVIGAQYSTDQSIWGYFDGVTNPSVNIGSLGLKISNWINIDTNAMQDIYVRLVGINGNGTVDPSFGLITLQIR